MAQSRLISAWGRSGYTASSSPLLDTTPPNHLLLYIGIYIKRIVDAGEGDLKWAFIVAPANEEPDSKGQRYWMAKERLFTGHTNVRGWKEKTLIDLRDEKDLLCRVLLAEVEDVEKLDQVMWWPQSPTTIMEDMKRDSMWWVKSMLGKLMREGCLKGGLVAWDVVEEEGLNMAENRVEFNEKHDMPKGLEMLTLDLLNREKSDEWLARKSEEPEVEDHAALVKRMDAYWDDDSPPSGSSNIDDEGGEDIKGPDRSPSLVPSKKPQRKVGEIVAKGKRIEAAGVGKTDGVLLQSIEDYAAPPERPPSSRIQPRAPVAAPTEKTNIDLLADHDSNSNAKNQVKSFSKSPTPSNFMTPPEYPVGHGKRKRFSGS